MPSSTTRTRTNLFQKKDKKTFQKSQLPEHKKILNAVNYKLSKQLKKLKLEKLKNEFIELSNFNQSDSRHWQLINKLETENSKKQVNITLRVDNTTISNPQDVAEIFAENLAQTFTDRNPDLHEVTPISDTRNFGLKEYISTNDLVNAINKITNKKSSGFDGISNKVLKNIPFNTLKAIHSLFNYSVKLGHIPREWKRAKVIMIPKKDKPPDKPSSY